MKVVVQVICIVVLNCSANSNDYVFIISEEMRTRVSIGFCGYYDEKGKTRNQK